ncbi:Crp/Fnr family transcriptional regulator [Bacillus luteolus]|uniref:Crp/Fnr family transcriptional regulator n=1 Tax=Litchfieldia luteola TaxID=682179 RepID=A0ABR9QLG2_9BACI|nr:Crp/Fnr family transcriptional regulator [Cytobacillus luteolus]MBE4909338.1 Crp/Fnr family transcriptional regulator [Cytobacillus luteolus]MBP1940734.1 CRP/FNR family transcriptional regulator [Cytobacillus luteolus]
MTTCLKPTLSTELTELLKSADYSMKMEKGSYLFQEGMEAKELYIIQSGRVKISKVAADGRELSLRICAHSEIVGELTLFSENAKYLFNAQVIESGEVAVIKKENIERTLFENGKLAMEFMKWMSDHFRKTQTKFRDLVLLGKKGALYSTLIRMTNSYGIKKDDGILINLHLTNQELANFCATTRESTNRMLNELRKNNIISISKGKIMIHDLDYLKKEINCEGCPAVICSIE